MTPPQRRQKHSIQKVKNVINDSNLADDTKNEIITSLITDLSDRLDYIEESNDSMHLRLAFGQVIDISRLECSISDYNLYYKNTNMSFHQIPFALQEKILRSLSPNTSNLWRCGVRDLGSLEKILYHRQDTKGHLNGQWDTLESNWNSILKMANDLLKKHEINEDCVDGNLLDWWIKEVKQDRDILAHSGFKQVAAEELKEASFALGPRKGKLFRFLLDLNVTLSDLRKENIYEYKD